MVELFKDGRDFPMLDEVLSVDRQVDALINEAQNMENLCQHFAGWCIHWWNIYILGLRVYINIPLPAILEFTEPSSCSLLIC